MKNPLDPRSLKCAALDLTHFLAVLLEFGYRYGMLSIDDWEYVHDTERYIMDYLVAISDYVDLLYSREFSVDGIEGADPSEGLEEWACDAVEYLGDWALFSATMMANDMIQRERDEDARILVPLGAIICLEPVAARYPGASPQLQSLTPSTQTASAPASSTVAGEGPDDHPRSMAPRAGIYPRASGSSSTPWSHPLLAPPAEIYDLPARLPVLRQDVVIPTRPSDIGAIVETVIHVSPYAPGRGQPHPDLIVRAGPDLVFDANTPSDSPPASPMVRVDSAYSSSCSSSSLETMNVLPPSSPWLWLGGATHRALEVVTRGDLDSRDRLNVGPQPRVFIVRQPHPGRAERGFEDEWRNQARARVKAWVTAGVPAIRRSP
jgi:hypothetical protein